MKSSNGEGSIYKRKDGRWCAAFYVDEETVHRYFVYGKTQAEVKKKMKDILSRGEYSQGRKKQKQEYDLQEWICIYLDSFKKNEIKATTLDSYFGIFNKHIKNSKIGETLLSKITVKDLQIFYNQKIILGYNAKTVHHIYILINSALKKAVELKYLKENVNEPIILPRKKKYEGKSLSIHEVRKIFLEAKEEELYPIVVLTICTGMRKGEIMALKWKDINFEAKELKVTGNLCRVKGEQTIGGKYKYKNVIMEPKTPKSHRKIPLSDYALEALKIQKERQMELKNRYGNLYNDQDFVFTEPDGGIIKQRQFMDRYHDFLKKYSITDVRFHDLRHTFASLLLENGESPKVIQEILGHTTITTTLDIYTHITEEKKIETVQSLERLFSEPTSVN